MKKEFIKYIYDYNGEEFSVIGENGTLDDEQAKDTAYYQVVNKHDWCDEEKLKFVKSYAYEQETDNLIVLDGKGYNKAELIALTRDLYFADWNDIDDDTIICALEENILFIGRRAYDRGYRPIKN